VVCVPDAFAGPADPEKNSTGSFACIFSRRYAMLDEARCEMRGGNQRGSGASPSKRLARILDEGHGVGARTRAVRNAMATANTIRRQDASGTKGGDLTASLRRKRRRLRPATACAALSAQLLPFDVDPKREIDNPLTVSNRQLETIRNRHNPFTINQMTFSNRPKISARCGRPSQMWRSGTARQVKGSRRDASATLGVGRTPNSNRSRYRLEINISPTKQRTEALSNRS
jgi:hypothetical protein